MRLILNLEQERIVSRFATMPKRMISTDISLCETLHECSEFAQNLFMLMIAHQDDWGRLIGSPQKVKAKIKPLSKRSPRQFERAIAELAQAGLICWYSDERERFIAFKPESCLEYQSAIHETAVSRGRKSKFPPPPDPAFQWPEDSENPARHRLSQIICDHQREPNLTKPNLTKDIEASSSALLASPCAFCVKPTKHLLQFYHDRAKEILARCLVIDGGSCGPLVAKREKQVGQEKCHAAFEVYLASEDPFVLKAGHSLRVFCSENVFNGCLEAAEKGAQYGTSISAKSPGTIPPDPKALPMRKVLEQIVAWYRDGIHPAEMEAYMRRAGLRWAGDAARRLEELEE